MARIKLDLPNELFFKTELTVRIGDINYGGHLANDAVLSLAHETRIRYLKHLGFSEMDCGGASLIMADSVVVYKSEAFHGEELIAETGIGDIENFGFDFYYRFMNKLTGKEVARVKTGMVFFDYHSRKITKTPRLFTEKVLS